MYVCKRCRKKFATQRVLTSHETKRRKCNLYLPPDINKVKFHRKFIQNAPLPMKQVMLTKKHAGLYHEIEKGLKNRIYDVNEQTDKGVTALMMIHIYQTCK